MSFFQRKAALAATVLSLCLLAVPAVAQKSKPKTDPKQAKQTKQTDWQKYLQSADRSKGIGASLASKALSFRGTPYRFGGTTSKGFDCSGLTQAVYKKWGMLLPRTSTEQFKKGVPVPKDKLLAGDLVFFQNTYRSGVSHVGIYVGEGKFVHAAGHGKGVTVSSLSEAYHLNHYAGARRIALASNKPDDEDAAPPSVATEE